MRSLPAGVVQTFLSFVLIFSLNLSEKCYVASAFTNTFKRQALSIHKYSWLSVFRLLFVLFLTLPLLEIYILMRIGTVLGPLPTVALCIFTAALGAALLRRQGLQTLARVQGRLQKGEIPATDMLGGVILLLAGILLLTPGFFTDVIGFLCLIPACRDLIVNNILRQQLQARAGRSQAGPVVVEGEFWEDESGERLNHKN